MRVEIARGLRVRHVVHSLSTTEGGGAFATAGWANALAKKGVKVSICATCIPGNNDSLTPEHVEVALAKVSPLSRWWPYHAFGLSTLLQRAIREVDLVHLHNLWHYPQFAAYQICRRLRKPYVISPHGALRPAALGRKAFKKRMFMAFIQNRVFRHAAAFHAITSQEAAQKALVRWCKPIKTIPNGIDSETQPPPLSREELVQRRPKLYGKLIVLFLRWIHL